MKLSKALKLKKRLASDLTRLQSKVQSNNSVLKGNTLKYDINELMKEISDKRKDLINLKISINNANVTIQGKIYELAETKSYIQFLKAINTEEGIVTSRYGDGPSQNYTVIIDEIQKDSLITKAQDKLDSIQEEIDTFNYTTTV